ncbi:zinc finger protein 32-like [Microplitis demolitor]|uniref:zinc finger protein 32-like n=1 Tax=Microplitis demolitor TaxID=69319 RepID=UPI00235B6930|nr:zinc finger protein 32-like [Microplitis demolitor]
MAESFVLVLRYKFISFVTSPLINSSLKQLLFYDFVLNIFFFARAIVAEEGALISILRSSFGSKTSKYSLKKSLSTASNESRSPRSVDESASESGTSLRRERSSREVVFPDSFEVLPQPRDLTYVGLPHEQQRKFRCRFCGKGYRWKSTMRRHETVECGGKPPAFQCPECPYKARQRGNLTVHYKRHHQKMPYDEVSQASLE